MCCRRASAQLHGQTARTCRCCRAHRHGGATVAGLPGVQVLQHRRLPQPWLPVAQPLQPKPAAAGQGFAGGAPAVRWQRQRRALVRAPIARVIGSARYHLRGQGQRNHNLLPLRTAAVLTTCYLSSRSYRCTQFSTHLSSRSYRRAQFSTHNADVRSSVRTIPTYAVQYAHCSGQQKAYLDLMRSFCSLVSLKVRRRDRGQQLHGGCPPQLPLP